MLKPEQSVCSLVGIGASAGGLDALRRLLGALPSDASFAVVVVQHLDPSTRSHLAEIIDRSCELCAVRARSGDTLTAGTVYVVPEGREPFLKDGKLRLKQRANTCHEPIDAFFSSLAENNVARGCGVVLSGNGSDGVLGLRQIQGAGGLTFAQDPSTAEYPSMPSAAIDAGVCDFVGSPEQIASDLLSHFRPAVLGGPPVSTRKTKASADRDAKSLAAILGLVRVHSGMDFSGYKTTTIMRRVGRRAMLKDAAGLEAYLALLENDQAEISALVSDLLINVTQFFRDPEVFDALRMKAFPEILKTKSDADTIRVWVVGCSTGEEVYSVLITALEAIDDAEIKPKVTVFGTDASESALKRARAGVYPSSICASVSAERLSKYFVRTAAGFEIDRSLRDMCVFARQDITKDTPFSRLDLVALRNVLIYMDQPLQKQVLTVAHFALSPAGILLLGTSETPDTQARLFKQFDKQHHMYRRRDVASRLPIDVANAARANTDALSIGAPALAFDVGVHDSHQTANEMALLMYAPPRVVVDLNGHILHFFGDTSRFLEHAAGRATLDVSEMARPGIALELKDALEAANAADGHATRTATFVSGGRKRQVSIEVTPLPSSPGQAQLMVAFRELLPAETAGVGSVADEDLTKLYEGREQRVRGELGAMRSRVRAIAEEKEQVNQSLRSANEEVRSANEELQSINEELETAKEELQSANEELITVNDELRNSNRDLGLVNDDLTNFTSSIDVPVLMLDRSLRVRRFTPQATRVARIENSDVGRLLEHLRLRVHVGDLPGIVAAVIESEDSQQLDVQDETGCWYVMSVRPYRSAEGAVDGAVVAFMDVDELKRSAEQLRRRATLSEALAAIDADLASTMEIDEILQRALTEGANALRSDAGTIEVREADSWVLRYQHGFSPEEVGLRLGESDAPNATAAARIGAPIMIADMTVDERINVGFVKSHGLKSVLAVPLSVRGVVMGCLLFYRRHEARGFTSDEIDFGRRLGTAASLALENSRLLRSEQEATQRAETLNAINEIVRTAITPAALLSRLVGEVSEVAGADMSLVIEVDEADFTVTHVRNVSEDVVGVVRDAAFYPAFAMAARKKRPVLIENAWADRRTNKAFVIPFELHAFQLLPLVVGGEAVAVLALAYDKPQAFDADDEAFAARLSHAMSVALANARLFEAEQVELARTTILREVASAAVSSIDVRELSERVLAECRATLGAKAGNIYVIDHKAGLLVATAFFGFPKAIRGQMERMELDEARASARSFMRNEIVRHDSPDLPSGTADRVKAAEATADRWVSVPIRARGEILGSFGLIFTGQRAFSPDEIALYQALADQMGVGLDNARLFEAEREAQARVTRELEVSNALLNASRALVGATELRQVLDVIVDAIVESTGHSRVTVSLWSQEGVELEVVAARGLGGLAPGQRLGLDAISETAREALATLKTAIYDSAEVPKGQRGTGDEVNARIGLIAPLVYQGRALGLVGVDEPAERRAFDPREVALIEGLVAQAAAATEKARLFEAERNAQQQATRQLAQTTLLNAVAVAATTSVSLDDVAARVLDAMAEGLVLSVGTVYSYDESSGLLGLLASHGLEPSTAEQVKEIAVGPDNPMLISKAVIENRVFASEDVSMSEARREMLHELGGTEEQENVAIPVEAGGVVVGVIGLAFFRESGFSPDELTVFRSMARILGQAIANARLFETEHEQARREAILKQVAESAASSLTPGDIAASVTQSMLDLLGAHQAQIRLVSRDGSVLHSVGSAGLALDFLERLGSLSVDADVETARCFRSGKTCFAENLSTAKVSKGSAQNAKDAGVRSYVLVPLRSGDGPIGTFYIAWAEPRQLGADEISFIESVASEVAVGLQNAVLFESEQMTLDRLEALHELAELATSSLDLAEVTERALTYVHSNLDVDAISLWMIDEANERLFPFTGVGFPKEFFDGFAAGVGLSDPYEIATAVREDCAVVRGAGQVEEIPEPVRAAYARHGIGLESLLVLPIRGRAQVMGALTLAWAQPREFPSEDVRFFASMANELAVAVENATLFESEQRELGRTRILQSVATAASSSFSVEEICGLAAEQLRSLPGIAAASVYVLDEERQRLRSVAIFGYPEDMVAGVSDLSIDDTSNPGRMAANDLPILTHDDPGNPPQAKARLAQMGMPDARWVVVPIKSAERILGVIGLIFRGERPFEAAEIALFLGVADTLASSLSNAKLYQAELEAQEQLAQQLETTTLLLETGNTLASLADLDSALDGLAGLLLASTDQERVTLNLWDSDRQELRTVVSKGKAPMSPATFPLEILSPQIKKVIAKKQTFVFDYDKLPKGKTAKLAAERVIHLGLIIPIVFQERVLGLIGVDSPGQRREFDEHEIERLEGVADQAAVAIENARLFDTAKSELARTNVLKEVASVGASTLDVQELAERALETTRRLLGTTTGNFFVIDQHAGVLRSVAHFGIPKKAIALYGEVPLDSETASARVALTGKIATHADVDVPGSTARAATVTGKADSGWIILPVGVRGKVVGTIGLSVKEARPFEPDEITLYQSIADQLGTALERAVLFGDLEESRRQATTVLESISDGFYALDRDWRFTYANAEAGRMMGLPHDDLMGRTIGEVLGRPDIQEFQMKVLAPAMYDGEVVEFERCFDQTGIWADIRAFPSAEGVAVYGRDITERRVAEEALRETRERADLMAVMLDESAQPFGVGNLDGSMGLVNRAYEQLTGYSAQELTQVSWATTLTPPEYVDMEAEKLAELGRTGEPVRYEKEYVRKDGTRVPIELLVHLDADETGEPRHYYAFVTDLSERKERERLDAVFDEIRTTVGGTLEFSEIVGSALSAAATALGVDSAVVYTSEAKGWRAARSIGMPASMGEGPFSEAEALVAPVVAAEQRPVAINDAAEDARLNRSAVRRYRVKSILAAPLGVKGAEIGVIALYHRKKHEAFSPVHLEFITRLARVVTLAIQNSMLYERERTIADTLQEALLMPPGVIDGIESNYLYRAASNTANVGGDFYDVFALGERHCAIVVGDVSGKGLDAARLTSLLHDGLRAYALETAEPGQILGKLNRLVCLLTPPEQYATIFLGVLSIDSGKLRYCTAGHPSPAIVGETGAAYLLSTRSPILGGFADAQFHPLDTVLAVGERLVLFTDGVTEARRGTQFLGEARLLKLLDTMARTPVSRLPQRLLAKVLDYAHGHLRDDTVILTVARTGKSGEER